MNAGFRPTTFTQLDDLIAKSQTEELSRNSPANIIRRFSLQQQILNQQRIEARERQSLGFQTRAEERAIQGLELRKDESLLSAARRRRLEDEAATRVRRDLVEREADRLRSAGFGVPKFRRFADRVETSRAAASLAKATGQGPTRERAIRVALQPFKGESPEVRIILRGIANEALDDPSILDKFRVEVAIPKKTAAALREEREGSVVGRVATLLEEKKFDEALDVTASEILPVREEVMLMFEEKFPQGALILERLNLGARGRSLSGAIGGVPGETPAERLARERAEARARQGGR